MAGGERAAKDTKEEGIGEGGRMERGQNRVERCVLERKIDREGGK